MSLIDELFELFRGPKSRGSCKKARNMVSKTSVIRMFGNCHQLKGIISACFDSGQYICSEFIKGMHSGFFTAHSNMGLVNDRSLSLPDKPAVVPVITYLRTPYLSVEYFSVIILDSPASPGRNPFPMPIIPNYRKGIEISMRYSAFV